MKKFFLTVLLWTLVVSACAPGVLSPEAFPASGSGTQASTPVAVSTTGSPSTEAIPVYTKEIMPPPKLVATLSTPHIDQGPDDAVTVVPSYPQDCGYQWAQQALPELSDQFLQSIQALQPDAQGYAFVFGENCVHADGTATFLPMETDFNVTFQSSDLTDETTLGEWIVKTMQVIENIPPDQIVGPRPGRVGIIFESNGERQGVIFYIDQYRALPAGLSNAEIYQSLKSQQ
jgi:hypothetical protein